MASAAALKTNLLTDEERSSRRHQLWLSARVSAAGEAEQVLIHNLSTTGLLFESELDLDLGDQIAVELPEVGTVPAEVVWCGDSFYGCEFASPIVAAAVSASRLRSPKPQPAAAFAVRTEPAQPAEPESSAATVVATRPNELSPLSKVAIIFGLATVCWMPIVAAVAYL
jgi:hypothetical protein